MKGRAAGRNRTTRVFVGRERELDELTEAVRDGMDGIGETLLVEGPAGIGKTRLAEEVAARAAELGADVRWGRCPDDPGSPPYWPFIQILRGIDGADAVLGEPGDDDGARFRLQDEVWSMLRAAAADAPQVLIIDDLSVTDAASIRLLTFLAGQLRDERIVIVALARDGGLDETLAPVRRVARWIPLRGLNRAELRDLVRATFDLEPPGEVMTSLWRLTEGNPFYADAVVRLLVAEGSPDEAGSLPIPQSVRDVVRQRLEQVGEPVTAFLRAASVLGRAFTFDLARRVMGTEETTDLRHAVDRLLADRILERAPEGLRFSHAIHREAVYEDIGARARIELHRRALDAIAEQPDADRHAGRLAHHAYEARSLVDPDELVTLLAAAGERAASRSADEEAAVWLSRALEIGASTQERQADLLLRLAEARRRSGSLYEAMDDFDAAYAAASGAGSTDRRVRAATGFEDTRMQAGDFTRLPRSIWLLGDALAALGPDDERSRAEIWSRRPFVLQYLGAPEDLMLEPARHAVELAEEIGDDRLHLRSLEGLRAAYWHPDRATERLATTERYIELAHRAGAGDALAVGELNRFLDLLGAARGDGVGTGLDQQILSIDEAIRRSGRRSLTWWADAMRATRALMRGELDEAKALADRIEATSGSDGNFQRGATDLVRIAVAWESGDHARLEPAMGRMIDTLPIPAARSALAAFESVIRADLVSARKAFEEVANARFSSIVRGATNLPVVCLLAEVCARLGDAARADELYAKIGADTRVVVMIPPASALLSTPHWLGVLAATAGRIDDAERHFEDAVALHEELGAPAWVARTRMEHGVALVRSGTETERGSELLRSAAALATSLGLNTIAEQASQTLGAASGDQTGRAFVREGDVWRIAFDGTTVRLNDTKGLRYLRELVGRPAEEIHVLQLLSLSEGASKGDNTAAPDGLSPHAQRSEAEVDEGGLRAYRERLEGLREEIESAESLGDDLRASRAREEADWVAAELSRNTGIAGPRRARTPAERTRVNVQRAIRSAIDRIARTHPDLARHLSDSVRTGTYCVYLAGPQDATWST